MIPRNIESQVQWYTGKLNKYLELCKLQQFFHRMAMWFEVTAQVVKIHLYLPLQKECSASGQCSPAATFDILMMRNAPQAEFFYDIVEGILPLIWIFIKKTQNRSSTLNCTVCCVKEGENFYDYVNDGVKNHIPEGQTSMNTISYDELVW